MDLDSDNDGILDIIEANGVDENNDGRVDDNTDSDKDGLADVVDANDAQADNLTNMEEALSITELPVPDTDGDGKRDFQDVDSDNDGISDLVESGSNPKNDANNDGMADGNVDENGIPTIITPINNPVDTDKDGIDDYRDNDSDNDGILDVIEGGGDDENNDGMIDTIDTILDGSKLPDTDKDGRPDYQDLSDVVSDDYLYSVELGDSATIDVLANDNTDTLVIATLQIVGTENPGDSLVVKGQGVWSIGKDNTITFTPEDGYENNPTPIQYAVENSIDGGQEIATVTVKYKAQVNEDVKIANLSQPVNVVVLANDGGDIDASSVEIVLPEGFMEKNPNAVLSEDGKRLVVPGEGSWLVESDGSITYTAEPGMEHINPTPISYKVFDLSGNELSTGTSIRVESNTVVGGVSVTNCTEVCDPYETSTIPVLNSFGSLIMMIFGGVLGVLLLGRDKLFVKKS
ncbi:MAG: hypothetical protein IE889_07945 [Campylobacterales bacterium]|nr:hypothetical protein [Campylobacterales bacterium]